MPVKVVVLSLLVLGLVALNACRNAPRASQGEGMPVQPQAASRDARSQQADAKHSGLSYHATVRFRVDEDGRVRHAKVIGGNAPKEFQDRVVAMAKTWTFPPGPAAWAVKPVRFEAGKARNP